MTAPLRVVKVGGSLFARADWTNLITIWLERQPTMTNVLIAGGGGRVDWLREIDSSIGIDPHAAHWTAVRMMSLTAIELAGSLAVSPPIDSLETLRTRITQTGSANGQLVFDPYDFLSHDEPQMPGLRLGVGWHISSDSIAARVALALDADELVLLKSASPHSQRLSDLAGIGFIDAFLPKLACQLKRLRIENLLATELTIGL